MAKDGRIRKMRVKDIETVSELIVESIRADLPRHYSPEVVDGLIAGNAPEAVARHAPGQTDYVYIEDGRMVGMIGVKRNEIGHLYVVPSHFRGGVGRRLVDFAAGLFRKAGYEDMMVMSALGAIGFYEKCGFREESRGSFKVGDGHDLEYALMFAPLPDGQ